MFARLCSACNDLGGELDYTAAHQKKLIDRQKCHTTVSMAIFHILGDDPENDHRKEDKESAEECLKKLELLKEVEYGDRYGIKSFNPTH